MSKTKSTVIAALAFVAGGILAIAQQANAQLPQAATAANQNKK
jgi:hypothetical protein